MIARQDRDRALDLLLRLFRRPPHRLGGGVRHRLQRCAIDQPAQADNRAPILVQQSNV